MPPKFSFSSLSYLFSCHCFTKWNGKMSGLVKCWCIFSLLYLFISYIYDPFSLKTSRWQKHVPSFNFFWHPPLTERVWLTHGTSIAEWEHKPQPCQSQAYSLKSKLFYCNRCLDLGIQKEICRIKTCSHFTYHWRKDPPSLFVNLASC